MLPVAQVWLTHSLLLSLWYCIQQMTAYALAPCNIADSHDLSRNNVSAFWQDPNWVLAWQHTTLEQHIITTAKHYPNRLISDRATSRHEKAIDPETGRIVGYARWILPAYHSRDAAGNPVWPEAMVPELSPEEEEKVRRVAETTPWNPNPQADILDLEVGRVKKEVMDRMWKPFMCLEYMAVHPDNQGQGIATMLVKSGMEQAKRMGLDIFILAFKPAFGVYERLGFRVERELLQDDTVYGGPGEYRVRYLVYEQENEDHEYSVS